MAGSGAKSGSNGSNSGSGRRLWWQGFQRQGFQWQERRRRGQATGLAARRQAEQARRAKHKAKAAAKKKADQSAGSSRDNSQGHKAGNP